MNPILLSIILGLVAALANVAGGAFIVQRRWEAKLLKYFVALGAGFMLATSMAEMIPESMNLRGRFAGFLVLLGYLIVHLFEHTITPHFHFGEETHAEEFVQGHKSYSVLLGLMIHTFFDGIAIASGFIVSSQMQSNWLGWIIFLAVFLHKIPEGFTVASVMLASGRSRGFAWGSSIALGAATLIGVLTMTVTRSAVSVGLPLSAGVTIYVAASDLIPEVNKERGVRMALLVFVGVASLFVLDHLVHIH
ncbi:MAG TPA: ZIP family metal transporter [Terriglobales bacterium]|jgi:ZIP family zinc transporter/zinc and cadmium transporter|nr:ZIP family metal transporter [Terriglobales bacterium]